MVHNSRTETVQFDISTFRSIVDCVQCVARQSTLMYIFLLLGIEIAIARIRVFRLLHTDDSRNQGYESFFVATARMRDADEI